MRDVEKFKNLMAREIGALLCPVLIWTSLEGVVSIALAVIFWPIAAWLLYLNLCLLMEGEVKEFVQSVIWWFCLIAFAGLGRQKISVILIGAGGAIFLYMKVGSDPNLSSYIRYIWIAGFTLNVMLSAGLAVIAFKYGVKLIHGIKRGGS